jgi:hydrogenase maturation protease
VNGARVIGLGNEGRGDDAAGLLVAQALRERAPDGLEIRLGGGDATALLDAWDQAPLAVIVDAVSSGAEPGTIHRFESPEARLPPGRHGSSHSLGLAEAIALGRALDRLPRRLVVYGIEGAAFALGDEPSPPVREAVCRVVERILKEVCGA